VSVHLTKAIDHLKSSLLGLASLSEEQLQRSVLALTTFDRALASQVIEDDTIVDRREVELEEQCLQILALYQPVAFDLRFVITVLKITNDLERIGDFASNIAERAIYLSDNRPSHSPIDSEAMASKVKLMLKSSLDSLINLNTEVAKQVCHSDLEIDQIHSDNFRKIEACIVAEPHDVSKYTQFLSVSRCFERIADLATNLAEDVIYLVDGQIVRHSDKLLDPSRKG